jgi:hypothetical protein
MFTFVTLFILNINVNFLVKYINTVHYEDKNNQGKLPKFEKQ